MSTMNSSELELTERQQRERDYYDSYCEMHDEAPVNLAPIEGKEKRPWNAYWVAYEEAIEQFHARNSPEGPPSLLDFGCGTGQTSIAMAKLGYQVSGFDISQKQVLSAEKRAQEYDVAERCHFSVQQAEALQYEDNSFDCILGIDILHHLEIEPSVRETYRVLKPGGIAIYREWIELAAFDRIRESALVQRFYPKGKSFEEHRTEDERKLNQEDLRIMRDVFPSVRIRRFGVMSRLCRILPRNESTIMRLERMDYGLFKVLPFLSALGGEAIIVLQKPS